MRGELLFEQLSLRLRHVSFGGMRDVHPAYAVAFDLFIDQLRGRGDDQLIDALLNAGEAIDRKYYVFIPPLTDDGHPTGRPVLVPIMDRYPRRLWRPLFCEMLDVAEEDVQAWIKACV